MSVTVPLRSDLPFYRFQVELDEVTYGLAFRWNYEAGAWFLTLYTSEDEVILAGVKVVVDWPVGSRSADPRMPPGALQFLDTTGARQDPGEEDLGSRVVLLYFTEAELNGEA
jgi:hypothetical protein